MQQSSSNNGVGGSGSGSGGGLLKAEPPTTLVFNKAQNITKGGHVRCTLTLTNSSSNFDILFRVRTTQPNFFKVKPSHSLIKALDSIEISVLMSPDSEFKSCKFMVKYVTIPSEDRDSYDFESLFKDHESTVRDIPLSVLIIEENGQETASASSPKVASDPTGSLTEVRQRNQAPTTTSPSASTTQQHPETILTRGISDEQLDSLIAQQNGVPLVLCILISLMCFLIGFVVRMKFF